MDINDQENAPQLGDGQMIIPILWLETKEYAKPPANYDSVDSIIVITRYNIPLIYRIINPVNSPGPNKKNRTESLQDENVAYQ